MAVDMVLEKEVASTVALWFLVLRRGSEQWSLQVEWLASGQGVAL